MAVKSGRVPSSPLPAARRHRHRALDPCAAAAAARHPPAQPPAHAGVSSPRDPSPSAHAGVRSSRAAQLSSSARAPLAPRARPPTSSPPLRRCRSVGGEGRFGRGPRARCVSAGWSSAHTRPAAPQCAAPFLGCGSPSAARQAAHGRPGTRARAAGRRIRRRRRGPLCTDDAHPAPRACRLGTPSAPRGGWGCVPSQRSRRSRPWTGRRPQQRLMRTLQSPRQMRRRQPPPSPPFWCSSAPGRVSTSPHNQIGRPFSVQQVVR